ncbi:membrane-anchored protein YejM (alkaline phosphatase superfamily), partial [Bhargavaea ullalensis]
MKMRSQTVDKVSLMLLWLQFFFFLNILRISAAGPR